jgi:uncharacterized protein YutE (UPF0331/DUF86 family)
MVWRKLKRIADDLQLLEPFRRLELAEYQKDVYRRKAVERLLQEIVEAAIDINSHLLVETGKDAPNDFHSSFVTLGEAGTLDTDLALRLAPSAGLRNRIVHDYERLDDAIVLRWVGRALDDFPLYIASIERWLRPPA